MSKQIDLKTLLENKLGSIDVQPLQGSKTAIENAGRQIPSNLYYEANSGEFTPETIASDYGNIRPLSIEEAKEFESKINSYVLIFINSAPFKKGTQINCIPILNFTAKFSATRLFQSLKFLYQHRCLNTSNLLIVINSKIRFTIFVHCFC